MRNEKELVLGMSKFGSVATAAPQSAQANLLRHVAEAGVRSFDTANIYGQGDSERLLGRLIAQDRSKFLISTKVGYQLSVKLKVVAALKPLINLAKSLRHSVQPSPQVSLVPSLAKPSVSRGPARQDFSPVAIRKSLRSSLSRLRTSYVDILYLHSARPDAIGAETVGELTRLKQAGLARRIGVATLDVPDALEFMQAGWAEVLQVPWEGGDRWHELRRGCAERGIRLYCRQVLAGSDDVRSRIASVLGLEGVSGIVIGSMNADHIVTNLDAVRQVSEGRA